MNIRVVEFELGEKESKIKTMRMKELTAASGVPRGTIQFYIREGLIPKPIKQSSNSAFYTEAHLNDILMIKELQTKRFLPLSVIKEIMKGGAGKLSVNEIKTLVELDGKIFSNIGETPKLKPVTAKQLSKQTGISLDDIRILEDIGIFTPIKKGEKKFYGEDDIRIAECRVKAIQVGLTPDLGFHIGLSKIHIEVIRKLVEEESRLFLKIITGKLEIEKIAEILEAITPIVNTVLGILHKKELKNTIKLYALNLKEMEEQSVPDKGD